MWNAGLVSNGSPREKATKKRFSIFQTLGSNDDVQKRPLIATAQAVPNPQRTQNQTLAIPTPLFNTVQVNLSIPSTLTCGVETQDQRSNPVVGNIRPGGPKQIFLARDVLFS